MTQALTNVLLMDAVVGCLQTQKPISAASKLAYFDKITHEGLESAFLLLVLFCFFLDAPKDGSHSQKVGMLSIH